jgi:hypothetical protein
MELNADESHLATVIGFDPFVCGLVKRLAGGCLERLIIEVGDFRETQAEADSLSVAVQRESVERTIAKLQPELLPYGYRAFWSVRRAPNGLKTTDEVVVLKTTDSYQIIRVRKPDGANYGIFTNDIVAKLKEWERRCQLSVFGAASDWVAIQFETVPEHLCRFAEEVYELCPDSVEQGVGLKNESDDPEMFEAARELCPELSPQMRKKLKQKDAELEVVEIPAELQDLLDSGAGFSTPIDMGIKLLAYEIKHSRQLFLWWD